MNFSTKLDQLHLQARSNKWLGYFQIFIRIILFIGFFPPGMQKVLGERFTVLAVNHPMGHYLEAIYYTGYYYTFIGVMQVTAAILLLIPRTTLLGAIIYFPIILNICILSLAVRFDGSLVSSPLMVMACLILTTMLLIGFTLTSVYNILPRNTMKECRKQCENKNNSEACFDFCNCIHQEGQPLNKCMDEYFTSENE